MNELMNLRDKRVQTWNAAKAFLESHRGTDGTLSAEDDAIFNKMMDEVDKLGKEVMRLEKLEALDVEMSKATSKPLASAPVTRLEEEAPVSKTGRGTKDYTKNFWNVMRSKSVSHEVLNALQVGTDTEGGYLVPDEYERTLIEALEDQNIFRQLAHVIHTSSGERKIPVVASKGTASWIDEEAAYPESDDSFGQVSIGAYKLATMIKISEELLNDSVFDMPSYIAKEFARRIGAAEEEAFFTGNGTGRPLGILAATGGAGVGVTAAKADAVTFDEVMDLFYSLRAPYRRNSVFIMNDSTVKALRKLKDGHMGKMPGDGQRPGYLPEA
jgi:HK97 family phage major capsid protein